MPDDAWQAKIGDIFVAPEIIVALEPGIDCRFMDWNHGRFLRMYTI